MTTATEGRWYVIPKRGLRVICCDCKGEHVVNFRWKEGKVQYRAFKIVV